MWKIMIWGSCTPPKRASRSRATRIRCVPDAAFVRRERVEEVREVEDYWPGPPDLAVEMVSPGDLYTEVEEKVLSWLEAGSRMVVDPRNRTVSLRRQTEIQVLTEGDTLHGGDVVPGWELPVADIFR